VVLLEVLSQLCHGQIAAASDWAGFSMGRGGAAHRRIPRRPVAPHTRHCQADQAACLAAACLAAACLAAARLAAACLAVCLHRVISSRLDYRRRPLQPSLETPRWPPPRPRCQRPRPRAPPPFTSSRPLQKRRRLAHWRARLRWRSPLRARERRPRLFLALPYLAVLCSSLQPEPLHLGPLTPFALGSLPRARSH